MNSGMGFGVAFACACAGLAACSTQPGPGATGGAGGVIGFGGDGGGPIGMGGQMVSTGGAGGTSYAIGTAPTALALVDVSGDGRPEIVVGHGQGITVLVNQGLGTFVVVASYATPIRVSAIAVGDFNKDGMPDLAVADGGVGVFLNAGNGAFSPVVGYAAPGAFSIATADLDGDGLLDLAVGGDTTQILLGRAGGTFSAAVAVGPYTHQDVALADLDGDGKPDLIVPAPPQADAVAVMRNLGQASFADPQQYSLGGLPILQAPVSVVAGDLNRDGRPDIVASWPGRDTGAGYSFVLLTSTAGVPGTATAYGTGAPVSLPYSAGPPGIGPNLMAIGDVNGDGANDLVAINGGGQFLNGNVGLLLNHGDGTFSAATALVTGKNPIAAAVGDVDGDGTNDIVVANYGSNDVTVLRQAF